MSYAAVLTHVQAESDTAPRLACAIDMAERFKAGILGVGAEMIPPLAFDGGFYSLEADWVTAMRQSIEDRLAQARETFTTAVKPLGERATWASGLQLPAPALAAASRAADLIVAGGAPRRAGDPYRDADPAELALISGRPVLVAPSHGKALEAKKVVLGWKDTREARRALSDALPFLEGANAVEVAEVCDPVDEEQARIRVTDVVGALNRRGVRAEGKVIAHAHGGAEQLLHEADAFGADLIAVGAYGHSRLGEWVFGGFTRELLAQDRLYLLLSH
jgi:nucleotide-binding universal stress UspA family protein